jgi:HTH-type transcriptional regulator/antitoxin HigA
MLNRTKINGRSKKMPTIDLEKTRQAWTNLKPILFIPRSESEYEQLVIMLDNLIDEIGENENHSLASLMEILGILIENYEQENVPEL